MTRGEKAKALFEEGYNCAQAVFCAFADEMGMEVDQAAKLVSTMGGGMGRMREVCGAVSGMLLAAGAMYGYSDPKASDDKTRVYDMAQQMALQFREKFGTVICRELLSPKQAGPSGPVATERTAQFYQDRPCPELVRYAADILQQYMEEHA